MHVHIDPATRIVLAYGVLAATPDNQVIFAIAARTQPTQLQVVQTLRFLLRCLAVLHA